MSISNLLFLCYAKVVFFFFQMHNSLVSGQKTKERILQRFYWYSLKDDVALRKQMCDTCAADKRPAKVPRSPMGNKIQK